MQKIRRATKDDINVLVQLRVDFFEELGHFKHDTQREEFRKVTDTYIKDALLNGTFVVLVAEENEKIIATSGLVFFEKPPTPRNPSGREGYIMNIYTLPAYRRKGLATILLKEIIQFAMQSSAKRVWLRAEEAGKSVYEKIGFTYVDGIMEMVWK